MIPLVIASQLDAPVNEALMAQIPDLHVVAVPPGTPAPLPLDAKVLLAAPFVRPGTAAPERPAGWPFGLQWVQLASSGIDFYPRWLFSGVRVTSARGSYSEAIGEYVLAAIFSAARRIPELWVHSPEQWHFAQAERVAGSVLGLVGFGDIGRSLAAKAQALGMEVLAVRHSAASFEVPGVQRAASLEDLFARADHVVLAAPATPQTRHIVNRAVLAQAKRGLHLINVARGSLVDDEALLAALDQGRVALATLDVTDPEPLPADHRYYRHPRVRLSPHSSPASPQPFTRLIERFGANLQRFRSGAPLADLVDLDRGY